MALLVVGIGLAALLGLFPAALRESSLASADTSQAMFADQVLNMLHANASVITNWSQWNGAYTNFLKGVNPAPEDDVRVPVVNPDGFANILEGQHTITNYLTKGSFIEYNLNLSRPTENIVRAWLRVADRKMTDINKNPIYYTEFIFMGM